MFWVEGEESVGAGWGVMNFSVICTLQTHKMFSLFRAFNQFLYICAVVDFLLSSRLLLSVCVNVCVYVCVCVVCIPIAETFRTRIKLF